MPTIASEKETLCELIGSKKNQRPGNEIPRALRTLPCPSDPDAGRRVQWNAMH
jgi:hypothetical protein